MSMERLSRYRRYTGPISKIIHDDFSQMADGNYDVIESLRYKTFNFPLQYRNPSNRDHGFWNI